MADCCIESLAVSSDGVVDEMAYEVRLVTGTRHDETNEILVERHDDLHHPSSIQSIIGSSHGIKCRQVTDDEAVVQLQICSTPTAILL